MKMKSFTNNSSTGTSYANLFTSIWKAPIFFFLFLLNFINLAEVFSTPLNLVYSIACCLLTSKVAWKLTRFRYEHNISNSNNYLCSLSSRHRVPNGNRKQWKAEKFLCRRGGLARVGKTGIFPQSVRYE